MCELRTARSTPWPTMGKQTQRQRATARKRAIMAVADGEHVPVMQPLTGEEPPQASTRLAVTELELAEAQATLRLLRAQKAEYVHEINNLRARMAQYDVIMGKHNLDPEKEIKALGEPAEPPAAEPEEAAGG